eukprot:6483634-Amphidinium_carterae.1
MVWNVVLDGSSSDGGWCCNRHLRSLMLHCWHKTPPEINDPTSDINILKDNAAKKSPEVTKGCLRLQLGVGAVLAFCIYCGLPPGAESRASATNTGTTAARGWQHKSNPKPELWSSRERDMQSLEAKENFVRYSWRMTHDETCWKGCSSALDLLLIASPCGCACNDLLAAFVFVIMFQASNVRHLLLHGFAVPT